MTSRTCPSCGGSGRPRDVIEDMILRLPCRECRGLGHVEDYSYYPPEDNDEYDPNSSDDEEET